MKCEKILFLNCLKYNAQMVKQAAAKLEALPVFTVYKNPKDYPDNVVVRLHFAGAKKIYIDNKAVVVNTIAEAHQVIPIAELGLHKFDGEKTEPQVAESWL